MGGVTTERGLVEVLVEASKAMRLNELDAAVRRLGDLVGASGTLLARYGHDGHPQAVAGDLVPTVCDYMRERYTEDPIHAAKRDRTARTPIVHSGQLLEARWFCKSPAHDYYREHALRHLICISMTPDPWGEPGMVGLLIARSPRAGDFPSSMLDVLAAAQPAFAAAARRCERLAVVEGERTAAETMLEHTGRRAYVVFDLHGRPLWTSPSAERLLGTGELPAPIRRSVIQMARLAAGELPRTTRLDGLELVLDGPRRVTGEIFVSRAVDGDQVIVCALDEPDRGGLPPILAERYDLTPAERAVLALLAEGLSNQAIADRLFVSIETVRSHVKGVLRKLGVRTRLHAALLVRGHGAVAPQVARGY